MDLDSAVQAAMSGYLKLDHKVSDDPGEAGCPPLLSIHGKLGVFVGPVHISSDDGRHLEQIRNIVGSIVPMIGEPAIVTFASEALGRSVSADQISAINRGDLAEQARGGDIGVQTAIFVFAFDGTDWSVDVRLRVIRDDGSITWVPRRSPHDFAGDVHEAIRDGWSAGHRLAERLGIVGPNPGLLVTMAGLLCSAYDIEYMLAMAIPGKDEGDDPTLN